MSDNQILDAWDVNDYDPSKDTAGDLHAGTLADLRTGRPIICQSGDSAYADQRALRRRSARRAV